MKSRILITVLVVALSAALIGGATMAWFTDEAVSDPVTFTAGTLMINLTQPLVSSELEHFNIGTLNPGDCWEYEFEVENVGTKSFNWGIYACWRDIIGQNNEGLPEGQIDLLKARDFGTDPLSDVIDWAVYVGDAADPLVEGKLAGETSPFGTFDPEVLAALESGETVTVKLTACLPEDAGNEYQGSTMEFIVGVKAWQTTNDAPAPLLEDVDCSELFAAADDDDVDDEFTFTRIYQPGDHNYTGITKKIDISTLDAGSWHNSITDGDLTVGFSSAMARRNVGGSWYHWAAPPYTESASPEVLFTGFHVTELTLTLSQPCTIFGFEMEPNGGEFDYDVEFVVSSGGTVLGTITENLNWEGGTRLFAAEIGGASFDRIEIHSPATATDGFAIAQVRYKLAE